MKSFQDLDVWRISMELAEKTYRATQELPQTEAYGLTSQMRRASVSIAANIAEGAGRSTKGEFAQFLGIAQGSQSELTTLTLLAQRIYKLSDAEELLALAARVGQMVTKLRQSMRTKPPG